MTEEHELILRKLSTISRNSPAWEAIEAIFDEQIDISSDEVCDPKLSDEMAHFNRGRLSMVRDLFGVLEGCMDDVDQLRNE